MEETLSLQKKRSQYGGCSGSETQRIKTWKVKVRFKPTNLTAPKKKRK